MRLLRSKSTHDNDEEGAEGGGNEQADMIETLATLGSSALYYTRANRGNESPFMTRPQLEGATTSFEEISDDAQNQIMGYCDLGALNRLACCASSFEVSSKPFQMMQRAEHLQKSTLKLNTRDEPIFFVSYSRRRNKF